MNSTPLRVRSAELFQKNSCENLKKIIIYFCVMKNWTIASYERQNYTVRVQFTDAVLQSRIKEEVRC